MLTYWLRLIPQQPIILDDPHMVPGRTIRGAIAAVARRGCIPGAIHDSGPCSPTCSYWALFGIEAPGATIRISDACASRIDTITPFPLSAGTCRIAPGFLPGGHGICDTAIRAWVFESAAAHPDRLLIPFESVCPRCGADWIAWPDDRGWLAHPNAARWEASTVSITSIVSAHRAGSTTPFSQSGTLLPDGAYYVAQVEVPDALDQPLRSALREGITIGARRTRGAGLMRAELISRPPPESTLHARIQEFNRALRAERRFYAMMQGVPLQTGSLGGEAEEGSWLFTLDIANLHLPDGQFNPVADVPGLAPVQIVRRWVESDTGDGYRTASAQRSGTRLIQRGAWLCRVPPEADRASVEQTLAYLETHGLGLDSARGGGTVTVCHPFHLEGELC